MPPLGRSPRGAQHFRLLQRRLRCLLLFVWRVDGAEANPYPRTNLVGAPNFGSSLTVERRSMLVMSELVLTYAYNVYTVGMRFEFDPLKAAINLRKHRVPLADAEGVFNDALAVHIEDPDAEHEQPEYESRVRLLER